MKHIYYRRQHYIGTIPEKNFSLAIISYKKKRKRKCLNCKNNEFALNFMGNGAVMRQKLFV